MTFVRLVAIALIALTLLGCGQKGPLIAPEPAPAAAEDDDEDDDDG